MEKSRPMNNKPVAILSLITALSLVGCAGLMSIPDEHELVSNHRTAVNSAADNSCDFSTGRNNPAENESRPGLDPEAITLLNWNVYKGTRDSWPADFRRLSGRSDIVALQEAQLHDNFKNGLAESRLHWDLTTAFTYGDAQTGVLLASKTRPGTVCALHAQEPIISIPKSALVTVYPVAGTDRKLMVANIHMINFSFDTVAYRQQISQLKQVLLQHQGALIMTGDFNTWSGARTAIMHELTGALELRAVDYPVDYRLTVFGRPLDHIYYRGLEVDSVLMEQVESSDHNPMLVSFRLNGL